MSFAFSVACSSSQSLGTGKKGGQNVSQSQIPTRRHRVEKMPIKLKSQIKKTEFSYSYNIQHGSALCEPHGPRVYECGNPAISYRRQKEKGIAPTPSLGVSWDKSSFTSENAAAETKSGR
jgi:hypothetical protein